MIRHLRVWQKLALLGGVFLIPFAVVTYQLIASVNTLGIDFARQELRGIEYSGPVRMLLREIQMMDPETDALLGSGGANPPNPAAQTARVEEAVRAVDEADSRHGAALKLGGDWRTLKGEVRELLRQMPNLPAEQLKARRADVTERIGGFLETLADNANLTMDPEFGTYYLVDALFLHGPEVTRALGSALALGTSVAANRSATPAEVRELTRLGALLEHYHADMDTSLEKAMGTNASLRAKLTDQRTAAKAGTVEAVRLIDAISTSSVVVPAREFHDTLTRAMNGIYDLDDQLAPTLREQVEARLEKQRSQLVLTLGWAAAGLLAVLLIGALIMRDIVKPLNDVVGVADRVASGDLSATVPESGRRDEMGRLGASLSTMITRLSGLVGQVRKSGIQVTTSATEISATSRQQQATANEVAATTAEIGATSTEIYATSKELVKTISEVAAVAEETAELAGSGQAGLARMEATMRQITEASSSINSKLAVLNERAGNINTVVTTIAKVADQTNLLSLNAAIEAEKAGEYGRGFAVVATEIRRLADQTAVATYDIEKMVQEMHSAVSAGVMGMDKFSEEVRQGVDVVGQVSRQLSQIIQQVQALTPSFEMVQEGMQSQSAGAQQISEALAQLSEAAQQTVESMHQSNQSIEQLNDAVRGLQSGVARFTLQE